MTTHESERIAFWQRQWLQHITTCDVCNYNQECRMCEGAYPDAVESDVMHNCNCIHGLLTNGAHIRAQLDREIEAQRKAAEPIPVIKSFSWKVNDIETPSIEPGSSAILGVDSHSLLEVEVTLSNGWVHRGVFRR